MGLLNKLGFTIAKGKDSHTFAAPIVFSEITYFDLSADYVVSGGLYDKGVFFKCDTAGLFTCVTFAQYLDNGGKPELSQAEKLAVVDAAVAAGDEANLYLAAYQWVDTPIVRISKTDAAGNQCRFC